MASVAVERDDEDSIGVGQQELEIGLMEDFLVGGDGGNRM